MNLEHHNHQQLVVKVEGEVFQKMFSCFNFHSFFNLYVMLTNCKSLFLSKLLFNAFWEWQWNHIFNVLHLIFSVFFYFVYISEILFCPHYITSKHPTAKAKQCIFHFTVAKQTLHWYHSELKLQIYFLLLLIAGWDIWISGVEWSPFLTATFS